MPTLKNAKYEAFAQGLAKGRSQEDAYAEAGFKPHRQNASRLMTNDDIQRRVAELQGKAAQKVSITVESLATELEEARQIAITEKQSSAAVSATMGKAKLFGLGSENRKISGTLQVITISAKQLEALTDDELASLENAYPVLQKLGLVAAGDQSTEAGEGREQED